MSGSIRRIRAVAAREIRSAFVTANAWIVLALAGVVAAVAFFGAEFDAGRPATLRSAILAAGWALLATAPAISMRSFSEEFRLKTWETLFGSPLSAWEMVVGKTLASIALVAASLAPLLVLLVPLEIYAAPDYGEIGCGLLGLLLAGSAAAALGVAVSTFTASQTVAFLGAFFLWLGIVAGARILTATVPLEWAPAVNALDPLKRLEGFALGLFDTSAIAYFLALIAIGIAVATVSLERFRNATARTAMGRIAVRVESIGFVVAVVALAASTVALLSQGPARTVIDATKTRAYSLAPTTVELLRSLGTTESAAGAEGWKIYLFVERSQADAAVLRQIDEVLERFREANPAIDARRIDPVDPADAGLFEEALAELVAMRAEDMARSTAAIESALAVYDALRAESLSQPAALRAAAQQLPAGSALRTTLEQAASMFAQIAADGEQFRAAVVGMAGTSAARPLPDLEGARSALAQGFRTWGDQLASASSTLLDARASASLPQPVRAVISSRVGEFESMATRLLAARQELEALPAIEIDLLGRELLAGEAAIVAGRGRLSVIPAWRIFPRTVGRVGADRVTYSWSFRGEEVLSGAIRSLAGDSMPQVVFMHSERESLLRRRANNVDLTAVADALRTGGFDFVEWVPGRGQAPTPPAGRPQVFVVLPALQRAQLELTREERLLVTETERLLSEGRPVLLTMGRSMLSLLGQADPWRELLKPYGVDVDATRVVLELVAQQDGTPTVQTWQLIEQPTAGSDIATRLEGQPILLNQPMPIRLVGPPPQGVRSAVAVEVAPAPGRWLADDWRGDGDGIREVPAAKRLPAPVPVALLVERGDGAEARRLALVSSGGWMLSNVADLSDQLGGGRTALVNPGNRELLLAMVAWLADRDDLLGAGLSGREVPRIAGLSDGARVAWALGLGATLALGPIAFGAIVIARRRRRA